MTTNDSGQEDDLKPFITEIREGDAVLYAHEICPHIFELIEEAGILGYVNYSAWVRETGACDQCKLNLISLAQRALDGVEIPGPMKFLVQSFFDKATARITARQDPPR